MKINELRYIIRKIIKENIEENNFFNKFPLSALVSQAKKFNDFKEFSNFYSLDVCHGYYWHLTKNKDFKISSEIGTKRYVINV